MPKKTKKETTARTGQQKKRKLAIVMSGGGMKCVYGTGVLTALVEEYGVTAPDIVVAASGSAAVAAYYLSGQYRETISAMLSTLASKRFISFTRTKMIDIDYLIDDVFKGMHPFDFKTFRSTKTTLLLAATRTTDGETIFLDPPRDERIYEYLRAAKAIPIVYGKEVTIGTETYMDGDFGSNLPDLINKALAAGADDIVAVEHEPGLNKKYSRKVLMRLLAIEKRLKKEKGEALAALRELKESDIVRKDSARLLILAPTKPLGVRTLSRNKLALRTAFNLGYADAANNEELAKLLEDHAPTRRK